MESRGGMEIFTSENEAWFHRIKAAQRDLIKLCGGLDRCVELTSISRSHLGWMQNAADGEIMPIPAVLALEADCGQPLMTSVMAGISGRRLTDPDEEQAVSACVLSTYAEYKRDDAELGVEVALSMADGDFTPSEITRADRKAAKVQEKLSDFRAALASGKAIGGPRPSCAWSGRSGDAFFRFSPSPSQSPAGQPRGRGDRRATHYHA